MWLSGIQPRLVGAMLISLSRHADLLPDELRHILHDRLHGLQRRSCSHRSPIKSVRYICIVDTGDIFAQGTQLRNENLEIGFIKPDMLALKQQDWAIDIFIQACRALRLS